MAGNFSSKKVSRVARTGRSRRRNPNSASYGWYGLMAAILILGVFMVGFSRAERLDAKNPGSTPPLAPSETRQGDYWYEAYGVYICDKFIPNIDNSNDPYGIATQNDGIIHIHPYQRDYAGRNANLGLFGKVVDLKFEDETLQVPGDSKVYKAGEKCGDQEGELVIKEWKDAKNNDTGKKIEGDPKRVLLKDNAAVTFAFVPKGTKIEDIQLPPSAGTIDQVKAAQAAAAEQAAQTQTPTPPTDTPVVTPTTPAPAG